MKSLNFPIAILFLLLLTSCGKQESAVKVGESTGTTLMGIAINETSPTNTSIAETPPTSPNIGTISSGALAAVKLAQDTRKQKIEGIVTLDDLKALDPGRITDPQENHPRFVELQKKQMLLGIAMSQTFTPDFQTNQKNITAIREAREIWSPEVRTLDTKITEAMQSPVFGTSIITREELKKLTDQKRDLLNALYKSTTYREYLTKNQEKLKSMNEEMMKSRSTSEITALQKEIKELRKVIYGS